MSCYRIVLVLTSFVLHNVVICEIYKMGSRGRALHSGFTFWLRLAETYLSTWSAKTWLNLPRDRRRLSFTETYRNVLQKFQTALTSWLGLVVDADQLHE